MASLVLWDVDHTLIENAGVSKAIYAAAFHKLTSQEPTEPAITEGRTDRAIMSDMFATHGLACPPWDEVHEALRAAGATHLDRLRQDGHVLPGVPHLLAAFANRSDVVQTVVSGNIRENAHVKLAAFDLQRFVDLEVGGYGSDHSARQELVRLARARSSRTYGADFGSTNTVVIGDTPRDVEAGRLGGARVAAVATGLHSEAELDDAGADLVLSSLADTSRVMSAVLGLISPAAS